MKYSAEKQTGVALVLYAYSDDPSLLVSFTSTYEDNWKFWGWFLSEDKEYHYLFLHIPFLYLYTFTKVFKSLQNNFEEIIFLGV